MFATKMPAALSAFAIPIDFDRKIPLVLFLTSSGLSTYLGAELGFRRCAGFTGVRTKQIIEELREFSHTR